MKNITEAINKLISSKLEKRVTEKLDRATCIEIYSDIFYSFSELFKNSEIELSNESVNLLSQIYYDTVKVNGTQDLDPEIFSKKASFDEVSSKDLSIISALFSGSDIGALFYYHLKKRT
jgi:hypothetical protein